MCAAYFLAMALSAMGDDKSLAIKPEQRAKLFVEGRAKSYAAARERLWGIGVEVGGVYCRVEQPRPLRAECTTVYTGMGIRKVRKDSPAEKAGLKPGDIISDVDKKAACSVPLAMANNGQLGKYSYYTDTDKPNEADWELSTAFTGMRQSTLKILRPELCGNDGLRPVYRYPTVNLKIDVETVSKPL